MKTEILKRTLFVFVSLLVIAAGCKQTPKVVVSFDMPIYSSIQELFAAPPLDAVVIGRVQGVVGREVDFGTANPIERVGKGIPTIFYKVDILSSIHGTTNGAIIVAMPDVEGATSNDVTPWKAGDQLLLFLHAEDSGSAPGIKTYDHFFSTISLDNGVFDVLPGNLASPRMPEAFQRGMTSQQPVTFNIDEIVKKFSFP